MLTVPGAVAFRTAERIAFEGNRFTHLGAQALELSENSSYNVVDGNVISDVSDGGILMGVAPPDQKGTNRGTRITNNWIHRTGTEYHASSAVWDTATPTTSPSPTTPCCLPPTPARPARPSWRTPVLSRPTGGSWACSDGTASR
ncbi:right-handed parallel beta-helix repeat-containing protein [Streptomyces sp. GESEQ-35]|uniref:right-handed parallel beta-helix repeat-containing protein n=1 Tax=Streptomyces sp. GESEQ-35 TaxID=2812657 RepID=UPI001B3270CD|nr:right-handed parallel beta-helix repeat-containing protein [Streptomyces sp. GESEQ-35]